MTKKDYYLDSGEPPGEWYCKDARFGLSGIVGESEITNLYRGFSPNGKIKLVKNAGDEKRICAWDLTFSAPKSVSVTWACSSRKIQHRVDANPIGKHACRVGLYARSCVDSATRERPDISMRKQIWCVRYSSTPPQP